MKKTSVYVAAALAATLAAPAALADDAAAGMDAMRAVRDKETGQLRAPNHDELKALLEAEKAERRARGEPEVAAPREAQVRTYGSGMKAAVLNADYLVSVEARVDENGKLVVQHANPADEHAAPAATLPTE
jgi:hypothetical protein